MTGTDVDSFPVTRGGLFLVLKMIDGDVFIPVARLVMVIKTPKK